MKNWLAVALCLAVLPAFAVPPAAEKPPAKDDLASFRASMNAAGAGVDREKLPGAAVYRGVCQKCHDGQVPKAPARTFVELMTPESIVRALSVGIMKVQAAGLSDADRRNVAEYLSGIPFGAAQPPVAPRCTGAAASFDFGRPPRLVGWGFDERNSHFVPADIAGLAAADVPRLKLKWAFAYPNAVRARSRPTFAYGALYVGSQDGTVYALDANTGCIRWTFATSAEVRTAVVVTPAADAASAPRAYFGDLIGRVYALDATTGRELWRIKADPHPSATITGSPVYHDGTLYVPVSSLEEASADPKYPCCTFRGSVIALDARSGKRRWQRYTIGERPKLAGHTKIGTPVYAPSGAAVWNTPTLDPKRGVLYVGTGNNYTGPATSTSSAVLALDLRTGAIVWKWQVVAGDAWNVGCMIGLDSCPENPGPDFDIGSGTMLVRLADGSDRLLVGMKSGMALALDPETHERVLWSNRVGRGSIQGGIQFGMAFDGERLIVPISDMGNSMDVSSAGRESAAGPARPGLYALEPSTGKLIWESRADNVCQGRAFCDAGILSSIVAIPGAVFAGHMDGRLRAYDSVSGRVLWQVDTSGEVAALGGATAHGGTIGGGGPVVHDGIVYTNSGYGLYFHLPGNLLAAYSVDGR